MHEHDHTDTLRECEAVRYKVKKNAVKEFTDSALQYPCVLTWTRPSEIYPQQNNDSPVWILIVDVQPLGGAQ